MAKTIVLNPFEIDADAHSLAHVLCCEDESLTVQADAKQADINYIVKQFGLTHELPYGLQTPTFGDFSDIPNDYHAARMFMQAADDAFMHMSADVRAKFENDAGKFLAFVNDPNNYAAAMEYGLIPRKVPDPAEPAESPVKTPDVPPAKPVNSEAAGGS